MTHLDADWVVSDATMNAALGAAVRRRRERLGLTRPQLVSRLPFPCTASTLGNWEVGDRSISYSRLMELARALGTTAAHLLARAEAEVDALPGMYVEFDLLPLITDHRDMWELLKLWASNRITTIKTSRVRLHHSTVRELAVLLCVELAELVKHLTARAAMTVCRADEGADEELVS